MTALVGTGLATLAVSLTGVAGLSGDLQAAALKNKGTTPVLTPGEELQDTKAQRQHKLVLRDACAKIKREQLKKNGGDAPTTIPTVPTTPGTTPQSATSAREF